MSVAVRARGVAAGEGEEPAQAAKRAALQVGAQQMSGVAEGVCVVGPGGDLAEVVVHGGSSFVWKGVRVGRCKDDEGRRSQPDRGVVAAWSRPAKQISLRGSQPRAPKPSIANAALPKEPKARRTVDVVVSADGARRPRGDEGPGPCGVAGFEHVFQVRADGLGSEFPGLTTLNAVPGNLPMQATGFVGRDVEISDLLVEIRAHCLVTLTGVGGVGKTRLALQVAAELVPDFEDGVWLVELAPVGDPAAVPDAVATALGITAQPGKSVTASVAQACRAVVSWSFWTTASTSLTRLAISSRRSWPVRRR